MKSRREILSALLTIGICARLCLANASAQTPSSVGAAKGLGSIPDGRGSQSTGPQLASQPSPDNQAHIENQKELIRVDAAYSEIIITIFGIVEMEATQFTFPQQKRHNLLNVGIR